MNRSKKSPTQKSITLEGASGSFVTYELTYKNVKNINIRVKDGCVRVSAPRTVSRERVEDFVRRNLSRVLAAVASQKAELERREACVKTRYEEGGCFYYLGKPHIICLERGAESVAREDGRLRVFVCAPDDPEEVRRVLINWISAETLALVRRYCLESIPRFSPRVIRVASIELSDAKSYLANCHAARGVMRFRRVIACLPPECIRFIVLHELCHFIHSNHSKAFYAELARHLPDHRGLRRYTYEQCESCFPS